MKKNAYFMFMISLLILGKKLREEIIAWKRKKCSNSRGHQLLFHHFESFLPPFDQGFASEERNCPLKDDHFSNVWWLNRSHNLALQYEHISISKEHQKKLHIQIFSLDCE